jgi:hypothetical protein
MALRFTQPLTEMENKARMARKDDKLTANCETIV